LVVEDDLATLPEVSKWLQVVGGETGAAVNTKEGDAALAHRLVVHIAARYVDESFTSHRNLLLGAESEPSLASA